MSSQSKVLCGIIILIIPSIQFGGYFLLSLLAGWNEMELTEFQRSMFRAGHAHAGVIVILSLIAQLLADNTTLGKRTEYFVRLGIPLSAILIGGGFFFSAMHTGATSPNNFILILFAGVFLLAAALIILGVGLIKNR